LEPLFLKLSALFDGQVPPAVQRVLPMDWPRFIIEGILLIMNWLILRGCDLRAFRALQKRAHQRMRTASSRTPLGVKTYCGIPSPAHRTVNNGCSRICSRRHAGGPGWMNPIRSVPRTENFPWS